MNQLARHVDKPAFHYNQLNCLALHLGVKSSYFRLSGTILISAQLNGRCVPFRQNPGTVRTWIIGRCIQFFSQIPSLLRKALWNGAKLLSDRNEISHITACTLAARDTSHDSGWNEANSNILGIITTGLLWLSVWPCYDLSCFN